MSAGACKVVINSETSSAIVSTMNCMEAFHALVDNPGFANLSKKQQTKAYNDQIAAELQLQDCLKKFCALQNQQHLALGTKIDEAS